MKQVYGYFLLCHIVIFRLKERISIVLFRYFLLKFYYYKGELICLQFPVIILYFCKQITKICRICEMVRYGTMEI